MYLVTANYYNRKELVYSIVKGYTPTYAVALDRQKKLQDGFIPCGGLTQISVDIREIEEL